MNTLRLGILGILLAAGLSGFSQEEVVPIDTTAMLAEHQKTQESFEAIVARFAAFFQKKQKMVYKFLHPKSKTSHAAHIVEYTCKEVNYSLNSTLSDQSKFDGYIILTVSRRTNRACGNVPDVTSLAPPIGWENVADALSNDKETCFKSTIKSPQFKVRLYFKFFEGKWQFQEAVSEQKNEPAPELSAVFNKPTNPALRVTEENGVKYNENWLALVEE